MAFNYEKAFDSKEGFIVEDGAGIFSGSDSPMGYDAPIGSIYLRTNSEFWTKPLAGANGWGLSFNGGAPTGLDYHSGYYNIVSTLTVIIQLDKQSVTFGVLVIDGTLFIDGQLVMEA